MTVSDVLILILSKSKFNECDEKDIENRKAFSFLKSCLHKFISILQPMRLLERPAETLLL